jgi:DNA replication protein DnaC
MSKPNQRKSSDQPEPEGLRERVLAHLEALRLPLRPERLDEILARAERERLVPLAVVEDLLSRLVRERQERAIERRVRQAHFRQHRTLEEFDWKFNEKTIDRRQIEQLAAGDFIRRHDNLILIGQSGVGKSHLLQAIGLRACALGYRVRYTTSADLIAKMQSSLADRTLPAQLRSLASPDLLIIDEFGFDHIERTACREAASLLYKVVDRRHGNGSTALVSNVDFATWPEYLGDAPLAMGFMDRLVDRATILKITGRSFRAHRRRTATEE